jgi:hypothetical protein
MGVAVQAVNGFADFTTDLAHGSDAVEGATDGVRLGIFIPPRTSDLNVARPPVRLATCL